MMLLKFNYKSVFWIGVSFTIGYLLLIIIKDYYIIAYDLIDLVKCVVLGILLIANWHLYLTIKQDKEISRAVLGRLCKEPFDKSSKKWLAFILFLFLILPSSAVLYKEYCIQKNNDPDPFLLCRIMPIIVTDDVYNLMNETVEDMKNIREITTNINESIHFHPEYNRELLNLTKSNISNLENETSNKVYETEKIFSNIRPNIHCGIIMKNLQHKLDIHYRKTSSTKLNLIKTHEDVGASDLNIIYNDVSKSNSIINETYLFMKGFNKYPLHYRVFAVGFDIVGYTIIYILLLLFSLNIFMTSQLLLFFIRKSKNIGDDLILFDFEKIDDLRRIKIFINKYMFWYTIILTLTLAESITILFIPAEDRVYTHLYYIEALIISSGTILIMALFNISNNKIIDLVKESLDSQIRKLEKILYEYVTNYIDKGVICATREIENIYPIENMMINIYKEFTEKRLIIKLELIYPIIYLLVILLRIID